MAEVLSASAALDIVANCPFPLIILNRDTRISGYNRAFEELLGPSQASRLVHLDANALGDHPARALLTCTSFVHWMDRNNVPRCFEIHRAMITEQDHSEVRFFVDATKQAELERTCNRLENELEQHTLTDAVTGLLNSRGIMLALEPQVARSRRYNSSISVIMLAVHPGDNRQETLLSIARFLKDQLRWADLIACNEQQEFVLVLPETTAESALALADKLRQQLHELAVKIDSPGQLSPCYGVTTWNKNDDAATLLRRAAAALARARASDGDQLIAL